VTQVWKATCSLGCAGRAGKASFAKFPPGECSAAPGLTLLREPSSSIPTPALRPRAAASTRRFVPASPRRRAARGAIVSTDSVCTRVVIGRPPFRSFPHHSPWSSFTGVSGDAAAGWLLAAAPSTPSSMPSRVVATCSGRRRTWPSRPGSSNGPVGFLCYFRGHGFDVVDAGSVEPPRGFSEVHPI
jgi:hypothetical protein